MERIGKRSLLKNETIKKISLLTIEKGIEGKDAEASGAVIDMAIDKMYDEFIRNEHAKSPSGVIYTGRSETPYMTALRLIRANLPVGAINAYQEGCIIEGIAEAIKQREGLTEYALNVLTFELMKSKDLLMERMGDPEKSTAEIIVSVKEYVDHILGNI
jgi:hypothetical protein